VDLRETKRAMPPNLAPSKFQETPFGMHENIYGELTALPQTRSWWGEGLLPPPRLYPRSLPSDPKQQANMMGSIRRCFPFIFMQKGVTTKISEPLLSSANI